MNGDDANPAADGPDGRLLPVPENDPDYMPDPESIARGYQLDALEMAKKTNTIVFLETGSGKTLIAIMLLRSFAYELRKPSKYIAVFLVPTVVLVTQVFVMTPAILQRNLKHSFFELDMIKLLIFDECHHAGGRHLYACIMRALGDIFESIAGAILIDSGFSKETVWESMKPLLDPLVTPDTIKYQPVREFEEMRGRHKFDLEYLKTCENGEAFMTVWVNVDGHIYSETRSATNKKAAKRFAAKAMLKKLKLQNVLM